MLSDFEVDYLASLRVNIFGEGKVLAIPATDLAKALGTPPKLEAARKHLINMDQKGLQAMLDNHAKIYVGKLSPLTSLYLPAGWVIAMTGADQIENAAMSGVRCSFLPKKAIKAAVEQMSGIVKYDGTDGP